MKKPQTERGRICIIVLGILLYLIIMFPPVDYQGLGRIYAVLNWSGNVVWNEIIIEIGAAIIIAALVYLLYPVKKNG